MPASQLNPLLKDLARFKEVFDLQRDLLAFRAHNVAVQVMLADMLAEVDPDGMPWPELSELYAKWKSQHFPGNPMAVLYGVMKTEENLRGEPSVSRIGSLVRVRHGRGIQETKPRGFRTPSEAINLPARFTRSALWPRPSWAISSMTSSAARRGKE